MKKIASIDLRRHFWEQVINSRWNSLNTRAVISGSLNFGGSSYISINILRIICAELDNPKG